jgi:hypothetical protein
VSSIGRPAGPTDQFVRRRHNGSAQYTGRLGLNIKKSLAAEFAAIGAAKLALYASARPTVARSSKRGWRRPPAGEPKGARRRLLQMPSANSSMRPPAGRPFRFGLSNFEKLSTTKR